MNSRNNNNRNMSNQRNHQRNDSFDNNSQTWAHNTSNTTSTDMNIINDQQQYQKYNNNTFKNENNNQRQGSSTFNTTPFPFSRTRTRTRDFQSNLDFSSNNTSNKHVSNSGFGNDSGFGTTANADNGTFNETSFAYDQNVNGTGSSCTRPSLAEYRQQNERSHEDVHEGFNSHFSRQTTLDDRQAYIHKKAQMTPVRNADRFRNQGNSAWNTPLPDNNYQIRHPNKNKRSNGNQINHTTTNEGKHMQVIIEQMQESLHNLKIQMQNEKNEHSRTMQEVETLQNTQKDIIEEVKSLKVELKQQSLKIELQQQSLNRRNSGHNSQSFGRNANEDMLTATANIAIPRSRNVSPPIQISSNISAICNRQRSQMNMEESGGIQFSFKQQSKSNIHHSFTNEDDNRFNSQQTRMNNISGGFTSSMDIDNERNFRNNDGNQNNRYSMRNDEQSSSMISANNKINIQRQMSMPGNFSSYNNSNNGSSIDVIRGIPRKEQPFIGSDGEQQYTKPISSSAADLVEKLKTMEGAFANVEQRTQCMQCGRKFVASAMVRHQRICKKVFGQKRKKFNIQNQRMDDETTKANYSGRNAANMAEIKIAKKKSRWKEQSGMLRNALRNAKGEGDLIEIQDSRVQCPHCNRKFNEEAAERHIPRCKNIKAKPTFLKRRR